MGYNPWDRKESGMTELLTFTFIIIVGLPRWLSGKESTCQCRKHGFDPWVGKIPWRRKWQPIPVFLPGEFHGHRSLVGYSPWGQKESDFKKGRGEKNPLATPTGFSMGVSSFSVRSIVVSAGT